MRTLLPLYLLLTAAVWIFASQDLTSVPADPGVSECGDGTTLPPPPPPGPKGQG
jgi:hypothetical protein